MLVKRRRVGRGVNERYLAFARHDADSAEACCLVSECSPDLPKEGGNRSFAIGAGNGGDGFGLSPIEACRNSGKGLPRLGRAQNRDGNAIRLGGWSGKNGRRAAAHGFTGELHSVGSGARQCSKERSGHDAAAIFGNLRNIQTRKSAWMRRKLYIPD